MSDNDDREKVNTLLKKFRFAMFTTVDADGKLVSRPMTVQEREFDGDLWFFAPKDSSEVAQSAGPVNVTFSSNDTWLSVSGTAETVDDREKIKQLWNPFVEAWFPEGVNDPNVTLLRFSADSAEYWDTPGGRVASVIGLVKSKVTGSQPDVGESGTVNLAP